MSESQGFTPAEQDGTTPSTTNSAELAPAWLLVETLQKENEDLKSVLASTRESRDYYQKLSTERWDTILKARESIEDVLSGDVNPEQTYEDFKDAFDLLGVVNEHEVEFELTVTYRGTITLPRGTGVDDLDTDDFGINEPTHNQYDTNVWSINSELDER